MMNELYGEDYFGDMRNRNWKKELEHLKTDVRSLVIGVDWYIIYRSIDNNVCKKRKKILNEINCKKTFVNGDDQQSIRKCLRRI